VDVLISDQGRGVIPLRGRGSDRARALPHSTAMYAIAEKCVPWRFIDLDEVVVALESRPRKNTTGHAQVFHAGVGAWTNEQTRGRKVDWTRLVLLSILD